MVGQYNFDTFSIISKEVCSTMVDIIGYVIDIHNKKKWSQDTALGNTRTNRKNVQYLMIDRHILLS